MSKSDKKKASSKKKAANKKQPALVGFACAVWVASTVALCAVLYLYGPRFIAALESLDVGLPGMTELVASAGQALHTVTGAAIAAGIVVVGLLPVLFGARTARVAKMYLIASLITVAATGLAYFAVESPVQQIRDQLNESHATPPKDR